MPRLVVSVLVIGWLLAGCAHVPTRTAWALRSFDPLTTDPVTLRAAVAMPADAFPARGGGTLVLTQSRRGGGEVEKIEIALEEVPLRGELGAEAVRPRAGQAVRAFRIPAAEVPRLVEVRARAAARAAQEPGAFTGTLSVGIDGCRRDGAPLPTVFRVSTWIRTAETPTYVPLLENVDLVALVGAEKLAEAKVCPAT